MKHPTAPELAPVRPPLRRLWREFRIQVMPWIGLAVLAALAGLLWQDAVLLRPVVAPDADPPAESWEAQHDPLSARGAYPLAPGASNGVSDAFQTKD